jgi:hypothetical protein
MLVQIMKVIENQVSLGDELVKRMKKQMDMELMAAEDDDSDFDDADAAMLVSCYCFRTQHTVGRLPTRGGDKPMFFITGDLFWACNIFACTKTHTTEAAVVCLCVCAFLSLAIQSHSHSHMYVSPHLALSDLESNFRKLHDACGHVTCGKELCNVIHMDAIPGVVPLTLFVVCTGRNR